VRPAVLGRAGSTQLPYGSEILPLAQLVGAVGSAPIWEQHL